ncbi:MAG: XdhC family protein, partial [Oscillospiraceae bacterium]
GIIGSFSGSDNVAREMANSPLRLAIHGDATDGVHYFVDPIHSGGLIYLFGGGHVSLEVARLAAHLEYHVVVIDDRADFANLTRFPGCETVVLENFKSIPDFKVDSDSYILIITRGHAHDKTVLEWALKTEPKYIGMIGSKTKRDSIYSALQAQGVSRERLEWVNSPVGLAIGAQTPAEIAVSIMAEITACKYNMGN